MRNRLEYLHARFEDKVEGAQTGAFKPLLDADPTPNKKYAQWLIGHFLQARIALGDLPRLSDELQFYERHQDKLPQADRNIFNINRPDRIGELVRPFVKKMEWLAYLKKHHREAIRAKAGNDRVFAYVVEAYKHQQKASADWFLRMFMESKLLQEDMRKVLGYIVIYEFRHKDIGAAHKPIDVHATPNELFKTIQPFVVHPQWAQNDETVVADNGFIASKAIHIVGNANNYRLLHIKTKAAAAYYGRDTEWCTASTESDAFHTYKRNLLLLQTKDGHRYQLHFGEQQYRDENDQGIDLADLCKANKGLADLLAPYVRREFSYAVMHGKVDNLDHYLSFMSQTGIVPSNLVKLTERSLNKLKGSEHEDALLDWPDDYKDRRSHNYERLEPVLELASDPNCHPLICCAVQAIISAVAEAINRRDEWNWFTHLTATVVPFSKTGPIRIPPNATKYALDGMIAPESQQDEEAVKLLRYVNMHAENHDIANSRLHLIAQNILASERWLASRDPLSTNEHTQRYRQETLNTGADFLKVAIEITNPGNAILKFIPSYAEQLQKLPREPHLTSMWTNTVLQFMRTVALKPEWLAVVPDSFVKIAGASILAPLLPKLDDHNKRYGRAPDSELHRTIHFLNSVAGNTRLIAALPQDYAQSCAEGIFHERWKDDLTQKFPRLNLEMATPTALINAVRGTPLAQAVQDVIIKKIEGFLAEKGGYSLQLGAKRALEFLKKLREQDFLVRVPTHIVSDTLEKTRDKRLRALIERLPTEKVDTPESTPERTHFTIKKNLNHDPR